jgi:hypothetical protein
MNNGELTLVEALGLIATLTFRPFDESDYYGFSGVESENPMLAENDEWLVILDGFNVEFISSNGHISQQFRLNEV